jgi:hypothetical protein
MILEGITFGVYPGHVASFAIRLCDTVAVTWKMDFVALGLLDCLDPCIDWLPRIRMAR